MNKTAKNSIIYLTGSIIMAVLGIASSMLLTRIIMPAEYGLYGMLVSFAATAIMFISFGFDSSYTRFYYGHGYTQGQYMKMCLKYPLIIFAAFAVIMLEPTRTLAKTFFGESATYSVVLLIVAYIFAEFIHKFSQLTARMEEHAVNYIISNIMAKSGFLVVLVGVFFISHSVSFGWICASFAISCFTAVIINLFVFVKTRGKRMESEKPVTVKDLFDYGWPYMINNVLVLVIPLIEKLIIRNTAGEETLGIFTAAAVFQTVIMLFTNTLINIWNPLVYKHCDKSDVLKPIIHSAGMGATVICAIGFAFCVLLRRWLVLLLGSDYYEVYIIAPSVLFGALYHILTVIYSVGINIKKKTYHFMISPSIQAVISFLLCFLLIPKMGLRGIAVASLLSLVISKTYRISVGLYYYDSGKPEWKAGLICLVCVAVSLFTLFSTSFISDLIMFVSITVFVLLLCAKDLKPLIKSALGFISAKGGK